MKLRPRLAFRGSTMTLIWLVLTCAMTQVRSQVYMTRPDETVETQISQLEGAETSGRQALRQDQREHPQDFSEALLARIAKLELLDAKLSKVDVMEKVFHFVQLDANVARISEQVDRLAERLDQLTSPDPQTRTDSQLTRTVTSLESRLAVLEKSVENVARNVYTQLNRLHSQLDALLEKDAQLDTKVDGVREDLSQLLVSSDVTDDQLELVENNLKFLREELNLVKQRAHSIHQQQRESEAAVREEVETARLRIDDQVKGVEKLLQQRLTSISGDLLLIVSAISRAQNQTQVRPPAADYIDDIEIHPLEDAEFRGKFITEIRSALAEDSKRLVNAACGGSGKEQRRGEREPEPDFFINLRTAINSSLESVVSSQLRPADCSEIQQKTPRSGLFTIYPNSCSRGHRMKVFCEMESAGGGWTVLQRRGEFNEIQPQDFYNDWNTYKWGFGNLTQEFYLGNELIHLLTSGDDFLLRVELEDFSGDRRYAEYQHFSLDSEANDYTLHVGEYRGNAGDALSYHNGLGFTTKDREHDTWPGKNCATHYRGGWWYASCHKANLNGAYLSGHHASYGNGIIWYPWRGYYYSLKSSRMMVRPRRYHELDRHP